MSELGPELQPAQAHLKSADKYIISTLENNRHEDIQREVEEAHMIGTEGLMREFIHFDESLE